MPSDQLTSTVEQAIQRMKSEDSLLSDYLHQFLGNRGWRIGDQDILSIVGQVVEYERVARYERNRHICRLTITNDFQGKIRIRGQATEIENGGNVPTFYDGTRICRDLSSALDHITSEATRLEEMANKHYGVDMPDAVNTTTQAA